MPYGLYFSADDLQKEKQNKTKQNKKNRSWNIKFVTRNRLQIDKKLNPFGSFQ